MLLNDGIPPPRRGREKSHGGKGKSVQLTLLNPFFGRKHSSKTKAILSRKASVPKPWIRGEKNGMAGRTGSSNPNWKGGTSPERQRVYAGSTWRQLRRIVWKRDEGRCQRCGSTDGPLHMHHIKHWSTHPELGLDPENVVLYCKDCHWDQHRKRGGVAHQ